jgi:hypothetical protein
MKIFLILIIILFSFDVHASSAIPFVDSISNFFSSIWNFLVITLPNFIQNLFAYILKYIILSKISSLIFFTDIAYSVASTFLQNISLTDILNSTFSSLDSDLVQTLIDIRFFDSAQLIIEAFVARFILNMLGW